MFKLIFNQNQDLLDIEQFKKALSNSNFSEILFDSLSNGSTDDIIQNAWDILNLLPKNPKIVAKL